MVNQSLDERDAASPLAVYRSEFVVPQGQIYLAGNSLGLMSRSAQAGLDLAIEQWQQEAVGGWMSERNCWFDWADRLAERSAALMGAKPHEVAIANSTTVNLHQALHTLYEPDQRRPKVLIDAHCFPSDRYALQGFLKGKGIDPKENLVVVPAGEDRLLDEGEIIEHMTDEIGLVLLPSVVFTTGQRLDMSRLAAAAHARGALIGFDCSHSAGVMPHALNEVDPDFATWCTYKYMNAGPGAPAGLYVAERHHHRLPGLAGWFGSDRQAQMEMRFDFVRASGAAGLHIGTPPILSLAPLDGALSLIAKAGVESLRARSLELTSFLRNRLEDELADTGEWVITPENVERRGGHIALAVKENAEVCRALRDQSVIADYRSPDILRLAPSPLYNTLQECEAAAVAVGEVVRRKEGQTP